NWSNILLVFVPAGILAPRLGCSDTVVFVLNCIAIVPLADVLCRATGAVSSHLGETTGALLNVTMGNATEVFIFHALLQRQYMIVRASLLGSIIVNILLVLGLALIAGELKCPGQKHNATATLMATVILSLTTVGLLIPVHITLSILKLSGSSAGVVLHLSRGISLVLVVLYFIYLYTQLRAPNTVYAPLATSTFKHLTSLPFFLKFIPPIALLTSTILLSLTSSLLVDTIDHVTTHTPLSKPTVGLIVLPLVGNAAELVSGIMFAGRGQMDLAFAVSIGSAIQIALFVTPVMVVLGWAMGREMGLGFGGFEVGVLEASVGVFAVLVGGRGDGGGGGWGKGLGLLGGYVGIA
ncbi:uncharacterized protein EI97DRAFT_383142, partial [Westerdykella ornata]